MWAEDDDFSFSMHKLPSSVPLNQKSQPQFCAICILVPLHFIILQNIRKDKNRFVLGFYYCYLPRYKHTHPQILFLITSLEKLGLNAAGIIRTSLGKSQPEDWTSDLLNQKESVGFPLLLPNYSLISLSLLPGAAAHTHPGYFPSIASTNWYFTINLLFNHCFHCRWGLKGSSTNTAHQSCQNAFFMPQHCLRSELSFEWGTSKTPIAVGSYTGQRWK